MRTFRKSVPAITLLVLTLTGYAPTNLGAQTRGLERVWAVNLSLQDMSVVDVAPDGGHVMVAPRLSERNLSVLSGLSGARLWRERDSFGRQFLSNMEVGGVRGAEFEPSSYQYVRLPKSGIVLISDYSAKMDVIRARDLVSGKEIWSIRDHPWTQKFQRAAESAIMGRLAARVLAKTDGSTKVEQIELAHISDLLHPLPSGDGVLLRHLGGLACFDLRTGEKRWNIAQFTGDGIRNVTQLPDGDIVVTAGLVTKQSEGAIKILVPPHPIVRIDPVSGDVRWLTTYAVDGWVDPDVNIPTHVEAHGNRLIVHRVHTQVFDMETGELIYRHVAYPSLAGKHRLAVADGILYAVVNPQLETPPRMFETSSGPPPTYLRAIDLADGRVLWESERSSSNIHGISITGDRLLVAASGAIAPDGHGIIALARGDGRLLWKSPGFDQPTKQRRWSFAERIAPVWVSNMLIGDTAVYAASGTKLYALSAADGSVLATANHDVQDLGLVHRIHEAGEQVMVIGTDGLALYGKADGSLAFKTPRARVSDYSIAGAHVFLRRGNNLTIVHPATGSMTAQMRLAPPSGIIFGNVTSGLYVPDDGQSIFVLDKKHTLTRFRLATK